MKVVITAWAVWALGSYLTFSQFGTRYIIPYALVTTALFAFSVWRANKKK